MWFFGVVEVKPLNSVSLQMAAEETMPCPFRPSGNGEPCNTTDDERTAIEVITSESRAYHFNARLSVLFGESCSLADEGHRS